MAGWQDAGSIDTRRIERRSSEPRNYLRDLPAHQRERYNEIAREHGFATISDEPEVDPVDSWSHVCSCKERFQTRKGLVAHARMSGHALLEDRPQPASEHPFLCSCRRRFLTRAGAKSHLNSNPRHYLTVALPPGPTAKTHDRKGIFICECWRVLPTLRGLHIHMTLLRHEPSLQAKLAMTPALPAPCS